MARDEVTEGRQQIVPVPPRGVHDPQRAGSAVEGFQTPPRVLQRVAVVVGAGQGLEAQRREVREAFLADAVLPGDEGTKEETFDEQSDCDPIIEDVEVTLEALREQLHVYASNRGSMVGELTLTDSGDTIDCNRMGSGGYSIPSIVEPDVIQFGKCNARFVLHVEKDTVWRRFNEDKFRRKHRCILTHGGGQPPRGVRRLLHRLHYELGLPVYCLLDNDPWGYYIYSVIKQGSINLAYESKRMAIPEAKYLGLRSIDFERCGLSKSVTIQLSETDRKRAKQIAAYPWFAKKKVWQREIGKMIENAFKLEVEALISREISYVTEEYTPSGWKRGIGWIEGGVAGSSPCTPVGPLTEAKSNGVLTPPKVPLFALPARSM